MPELDGVRGLAIVLVLVWHFVSCEVGTGGEGLMAFTAQATSLMWSGVNLFFVLSGFLITGILLDHKESPRLLKAFFARRIFRILPLYIALCVMFAIAVRFNPPRMHWLLDDALPLWSYFTLTQNFVMASVDGFGAKSMAATWSLAVEEQFYILIPFLVRYMPRRTVFWMFVGLVALAPVLRLMLDDIGAYVLFLARADSLMMGGLVAFLVRNERAMEVVRAHRHSFVAALCMFLAGAAVMSFTYAEPPLTSAFANLWLSVLGALVLLVPFILQGSRATALLRVRPLMWFGQRSYSIYIFHMGIAGLLHGYLLGWEPALYSPMSALVTLLAVVVTAGVAELSFRYFEMPLMRIGQRFRYDEPRPAAASTEEGVPEPAVGSRLATSG